MRLIGLRRDKESYFVVEVTKIYSEDMVYVV
jgi:hypothetical protein